MRPGAWGGVAALTAALWLGTPAAHAGRACAEPQALKPQTIASALGLATRTLNALDASGAKVVMLARAGQDLSKYGLRYSHFGWAYRQDDGQGGHVWRVLQKLNQCGTAEAAIYRQGLGEFFLDDLWQYEAAWVVPKAQVQEQLLALLANEQRAVQLQHKAYSMVSYVWGLKYQQSNQWAIETLALAMTPSADDRWGRPQAQSWLREQGYQPGVLNIGALTRLGARVSAANVAFDDHPNEKRFSDRIETVTVDSVFAWMIRAGLADAPVVTLR